MITALYCFIRALEHLSSNAHGRESNILDTLYKSITDGNAEEVYKILHRDSSYAQIKLQGGITGLHYICKPLEQNEPFQADDRLKIIKILLDHGADINALAFIEDYMKPLTPLMCAVDNHQVNAVKLLLENGAQISAKYNNHNYTALHFAVSKYTTDDQVIKLLLEHGADINAIDEFDNHTPLTKAIKQKRLDIVKLLIEAGADVNTRLNYGESALTSACKVMNLEMIQYLIDHGATIDMDDQYVRLHSPFHTIAYHRHVIHSDELDNLIEIINLFQKQGLDINAQDFEGNTTLHVAVERNDELLLDALLKSGAKGDIRNNNGDTPLDFFFKNDLLLESRSDWIARQLIKQQPDILMMENRKASRTLHLASRTLQLAVEEGYGHLIILMLASITGIDEDILFLRPGFWPSALPGKSFKDMSVIDVAACFGYEQVVDRLIEMGHLNVNDASPLDYALHEKYYKTAKLLIEAGVKTNRIISWHNYEVYNNHNKMDHFKLICLIWESVNFSVLTTSFHQYLERYTIYQLFVNQNDFTKLMLYYLAIKLHINPTNNKLLTIRNYIQHNFKYLIKILNSKDRHLKSLRLEKVSGNYSKYDIITMKMDSLSKLLCDQSIFNACKNLKQTIKNKKKILSHEYIMMMRIKLAMKKKKYFDGARIHFDNLFENTLKSINFESFPDYVLYNIMSNVSLRDLKYIEKVWENNT